MNAATLLTLVACAVEVVMGTLALAFARAPGWRHFRTFALVAFSAAAYGLGDAVFASAAPPDDLVLLAARANLAIGCLHCATWIAYIRHQYADPLTRLDRCLMGLLGVIGAHEWRVIVGNGHSPEHACLHCDELKLLVSGDQVLPRISSNVSVFPTEPDADPLADWIASIAKLRAAVPDDVLVLPSHGEPFRGLHARLDRLASGHEKSLQRLRRALAEPKRAIDVFGALFARPIEGPELLGMATGESIAPQSRKTHGASFAQRTSPPGERAASARNAPSASVSSLQNVK